MRAVSSRAPLNRILPALLALSAWSCDPETDGPRETYTVTATVFHDENANGMRDADEQAVVPGVQVEVLGVDRWGQAAAGTGQAIIPHVPAGRQTLLARKASAAAVFRG